MFNTWFISVITNPMKLIFVLQTTIKYENIKINVNVGTKFNPMFRIKCQFVKITLCTITELAGSRSNARSQLRNDNLFNYH